MGVDALYRQIIEANPSTLVVHASLLSAHEDLGEYIATIRAQIGQAGKDGHALSSQLTRYSQLYKKKTGLEPLPPTECRELINRLSEEIHRRSDAHKQTDEYRLEQERTKDFLD